ncbi:FeoB-associated Cys-rich membrane protein [uncultured Desulfovibrio sp.]|uniref:FeoB-associated Cys-rich membrane protein n=1 Tax=Candidatus Desulfovibrio intestinavium TaxID=2838534 RepID=A0A9D2KQS2_9BACT|nr:FeoB-associated Cys-rich membrane protein [uncultured Desulfovibrio sp.]HJA80082.1 FeoB-associated Cys-rich membrane protein [Candidatus Desulfovibrio intestinavium]
MDTLLVGIIIAGAAAFLARKFYKAVAARGKGSCGCGSCQCGSAPQRMGTSCRGNESAPPCCRKP